MWFNNTKKTRRLRGDMIDVFKIFNGYENTEKYLLSVKEERRTRGRKITLAKKQCKIDIRNFHFHNEQKMNGRYYQLIV